jgi:hypothetical protein
MKYVHGDKNYHKYLYGILSSHSSEDVDGGLLD